jgi:hypothetical protein
MSEKSFLQALNEPCRPSVHDVGINIRMVHSDRIAHEWLQYLAWGDGLSRSTLKTLKTDTPNLKTLRLNFESWPKIPMFRTELWCFLRHMLANVRGLERIVIIGASKGQGMARRDPWSPAHFVGADDVKCNDLIPRMWECVDAPADAKAIRWVRKDGRLYLEVVSEIHLLRNLNLSLRGHSVQKPHDQPWPANGHCSLAEYENHITNGSNPTIKALSPSAVE